ncbi:MAG TPA: sugar phosphate nucleotidyltransferase [Pilimelia sp.]|nr:sugar phosphate nucleotidyltransferase [Pilimelia sp.]
MPVCAVILAAGLGRRLRPLTDAVPKALCPVGNVPLLDRALDRVAGLGLRGPADVAVNASYLAGQVVAHVGDRAHLSVEPGGPLGTAGALGQLRDWIAGRGVLVGNADAYLAGSVAPGADIAELLTGWDGESVRMLGTAAPPGGRGEFGMWNFAGFSLLPWRLVKELPARPADLISAVWRPAEAAGRLEVIRYLGRYLDTGTPDSYLEANLRAAYACGGVLVAPDATVTGPLDLAVVGAGARVHGAVTRAVVWPGGSVAPGEHLVEVVRVGADVTVPSPWPMPPIA